MSRKFLMAILLFFVVFEVCSQKSSTLNVEKEIVKLIQRQNKIHKKVLFDSSSYEYYFKNKPFLKKNTPYNCLIDDSSYKEVYINVKSIVKLLPRRFMDMKKFQKNVNKRVKNLCVQDTNFFKQADLLSFKISESWQDNSANRDSLDCVMTIVSSSSHIKLYDIGIHEELYKLFMVEGVLEYPSFYLIYYRIARDRQWSSENNIEIIFK